MAGADGWSLQITHPPRATCTSCGVRILRAFFRERGLCVADGDEGALFCAEPRERHCATTGSAADAAHIAECLKARRPNAGPLHHPFVAAT